MNEHVDRRVLVVSEAANSRTSLAIAFETAGASVADAFGDRCVERARTFRPTAAVIDVDGEMEMPRPMDRLERARRTGLALRHDSATLPIMFMTSIPIDGLDGVAKELGRASVSLAVFLDCEKLAAQLLHALDKLNDEANPFGTIEITITQASMQCEIHAGGMHTMWGPAHWKSRSTLSIIDREFRNFESSKQEFAKLGVKNMEFTGERLFVEHFDEPLSFAYEFCKEHLPPQTKIFHRFVLQDGDLEFVPFEVIQTRNREEYLRFVHPVARRLLPKQQHTDPNRRRKTTRPRRRVLFIVSNASGLFEVPGLSFKGDPQPTLGKLEHLEAELGAVEPLYGDELVPLVLKTGQDNIEAIQTALEGSSFDIVQYAGHSIRADEGGRVFLALPGDAPRRAVPYDAEDFARLASDNDVSLIVLSSCEGSSGLALSRMASHGIPAVAGFRWPVDDEDASYFVSEFHRHLCAAGQRVPVSTAFHEALLRLKSHCPQRLTGFSPVLMLQRSTWHDFSLEH